MLHKRDYIYYDFIFKKIKPKNILGYLYCKIRKSITLYESPSKVAIWSWSSESKVI